MTDGQSEACLWNDPDYDPDLPFGKEAERRRLKQEAEEAKDGSWIKEFQEKRKQELNDMPDDMLVSKIRQQIKDIEKKHRERRE